VNGILVPTGENLTQVQDRVLGNATSAPLFDAIPGYAVHGIRGGYQITENSNLYLDFGNISDKTHRGVSWGIDGSGRSVTVRYRYQF
jgi:outer membrane receptor protein involved in Fe transport